MPSSRGSSQPRDWNQVPHIAGGFFTTWDTRKAQEYWSRQPVSSPGNLPNAGIKPRSALQADSSPPERPGKPSSPPIRRQRREGLPGRGDSAHPPGGTLSLQSNGAVEVLAEVCVGVVPSRLTLFLTHGLQPFRLLCPWNSPGKKSGSTFPSPGDLPNPGLRRRSSYFAGRFFTVWASREVSCNGPSPKNER